MIETIQCPNCGSQDVVLVSTPQYQCSHCGTRFILSDSEPPYKFVDVILNQAPRGKDKTEVINALQKATFLDRTTAKIAIKNLPWVIQEYIPLKEGERIRNKIEEAGGKVTLRPRLFPKQ
jgi:ribosomal protein L7/L12